MKEKYEKIEASILSCLLQKPELMEKITLEDKYFVNYTKIWLFMKSFYKKYKMFDITMMCSIAKPKYKFMMYMRDLIELEPIPEYIDIYQEALMELYEETKKEKWIIYKVYDLANDLLNRNISTEKFKEEIDKVYTNAEEIFKDE